VTWVTGGFGTVLCSSLVVPTYVFSAAAIESVTAPARPKGGAIGRALAAVALSPAAGCL